MKSISWMCIKQRAQWGYFRASLKMLTLRQQSLECCCINMTHIFAGQLIAYPKEPYEQTPQDGTAWELCIYFRYVHIFCDSAA